MVEREVNEEKNCNQVHVWWFEISLKNLNKFYKMLYRFNGHMYLPSIFSFVGLSSFS